MLMPEHRPFYTSNLDTGLIRFFHMDCFNGMEHVLGPQSVDVIVTSPPYNIGVNYGVYNDRIPRTEYLLWLKKWGKLCTSVLKKGGSLFLNIGTKPKDQWLPFDAAAALRDAFRLQNVFHWVKSIYVENSSYGLDTSLNVGHFKPINSKRFVNDAHEYVFQFTHQGNVELDRLAVGVPYRDESNVKRWKAAGQGIRCRGNIWFIPYPTIQKRASDRPHPASFPPGLPEMCMKIQGLDRINLVLDPFLGIGNTAVACKKLGKSFVGFEIDRDYLETAVWNIDKA